MDNISDLPDDLLLRILSLNPTKDVIKATSLLSKRWSSLWTLVPVLKYDHRNHIGDYKLFRQFVYSSFLSNKAPVLQHLHLSLGHDCSSVDIGLWINLAVNRHVRELHIDISSSNNGPVTLPSSLYTSETLQRLTLVNGVSLDVRVKVSLPSLKTLSLESVTYSHKTSLQRLLSGCPNLEVLSVKHRSGDPPVDVIVAVPSLQRLHISHITGTPGTFFLDVPSLKYLKFSGMTSSNLLQIKNMHELVTAHVICCGSTHTFMKAITSVRRLTLLITLPEVMDPSSMIFNQLVHLVLYTFFEGWWDLLTCMLQGSPNLRFLKLINKLDTVIFSNHGKEIPTGWKPPSSVPECLLHSLEAFEWFGYRGGHGDKVMAAYVIKNATWLKTATFSRLSTDLGKKYQMRKELASVAKASASAHILFD